MVLTQTVRPKAAKQFGQKKWVSVIDKHHSPQAQCIQCFCHKMASHFELHVYVSDENDIVPMSNPGRVCFHSGWDMSSSVNNDSLEITENGTQKIYCHTVKFDETCTKLSVNFSSGSCSLVKSNYISAKGLSLFCLT